MSLRQRHRSAYGASVLHSVIVSTLEIRRLVKLQGLDLVHIRRKATEFSTRFCALGAIICDLHPKYFIIQQAEGEHM